MNLQVEFSKYLDKVPSVQSDGTREIYNGNIKQYLKWFSESYELDFKRLNRQNVLEYKSYLKNIKRWKNSTINQKLSAIVMFNHFLIHEGVQEDLVVTKIDYLPENRQTINPAKTEKKDVTRTRQKILDSDSDNRIRNYAAITLMATTGIRVSECCVILMSELDFYNSELLISAGKGKKPRVVYLPDIAANAVKEYLKVRSNKYKAAAECQDPHLFVSRQKGKKTGHYGLTRQTLYNVLKKFRVNEKLTPHELRHAWASWAVTPEIEGGAGMSIEAAGALLGHSSTRTTSIYTNPSVKKMKDKANKYTDSE